MMQIRLVPTISANINTENLVLEARRLALDSGKSLRQWAGEAIEAELEGREGAITIPFLRMADETDFPPDELVVHAIKQGVGLFRKTPRAAVDSQTSTRYNGEYFLRVELHRLAVCRDWPIERGVIRGELD